MILGKYFECLRQLEKNNIDYYQHTEYQDGYCGDKEVFRPPDDRMIRLSSENRRPYWDLEFYDDVIIYCYIEEDEKRIPIVETVTDLPATYIIQKIVDFVAKAPKTDIAAAEPQDLIMFKGKGFFSRIIDKIHDNIFK